MGQFNRVLQHIRRLLHPGAADTDAELLRQFVATRDEAAFTALVSRHGPMVRDVCRRLLTDDNDIDDALQATFLVLVRKAPGLRPASLAGWLHGVAHRVALNARKSASRRQRHEREARAMTPAEAPADRSWDDLRPVLDEELSRLPEKYRAPLVLCYLEGKTNEEAAQQLSWTKGTVSGRLARARDLLRLGLTRRGISLSAVGLATVLESQASARPLAPAALQATVHAVMKYAEVSASAGVSAGAAGLAEGVIQSMRHTKLKTAALVLGALTVVLAGSGVVAQYVLANREAPPLAKPEDPSAAKPDEKLAPLSEVNLRSVYLEAPVAGGRQVSLKGKLGGDATLHLDGNRCTLELFGEPGACTQKDYAIKPVKLKELPEVARDDPARRRVFAVEGAAEPLRLVVPATPDQPFRLLLLDNKATVTRVVTLEQNGPAKPNAIPLDAVVAYRSVFLTEAIGKAHRVSLTGKLGGDAELTLDDNACTLTALGDVGRCDQEAPAKHKVQLKLASQSEDRPGTIRTYDLVGAPARLQLLVNAVGSPRLLQVGAKGEVTRVETLEPLPDGAKAPKETEVNLRSAYLAAPFLGGRQIFLQGKLGGAAAMTFDGNSCNLEMTGQIGGCTKVGYPSRDVKLKELPEVAKDDPARRRVFEVEGAPEPMRLIVPAAPDGSYRLLLLDKKGVVVRVQALEVNGPLKEKVLADDAEIGLSTTYLSQPMAGGNFLHVQGKLGGDGVLTTDDNTCSLSPLGDRAGCSEKKAPSHKVQIKLVKGEAKTVRIYELVGAPKPMRLVINSIGPARLLELDDGKVIRVETLDGR